MPCDQVACSVCGWRSGEGGGAVLDGVGHASRARSGQRERGTPDRGRRGPPWGDPCPDLVGGQVPGARLRYDRRSRHHPPGHRARATASRARRRQHPGQQGMQLGLLRRPPSVRTTSACSRSTASVSTRAGPGPGRELQRVAAAVAGSCPRTTRPLSTSSSTLRAAAGSPRSELAANSLLRAGSEPRRSRTARRSCGSAAPTSATQASPRRRSMKKTCVTRCSVATVSGGLLRPAEQRRAAAR